MKNKKFFVVAGTFALAVVSLLAVSANKKRTGVTLYWQKTASLCATIANVTSIFTTAGTGTTISFRNTSGSSVTVFTSSNGTTCSNAVSVRLS